MVEAGSLSEVPSRVAYKAVGRERGGGAGLLLVADRDLMIEAAGNVEVDGPVYRD